MLGWSAPLPTEGRNRVLVGQAWGTWQRPGLRTSPLPSSQEGTVPPGTGLENWACPNQPHPSSGVGMNRRRTEALPLEKHHQLRPRPFLRTC